MRFLRILLPFDEIFKKITYLEPSHCPFICSIAVVASFFLTKETISFRFSCYHIFDYPAVAYFAKWRKWSSQSLRFWGEISDKYVMVLQRINPTRSFT